MIEIGLRDLPSTIVVGCRSVNGHVVERYYEGLVYNLRLAAAVKVLYVLGSRR